MQAATQRPQCTLLTAFCCTHTIAVASGVFHIAFLIDKDPMRLLLPLKNAVALAWREEWWLWWLPRNVPNQKYQEGVHKSTLPSLHTMSFSFSPTDMIMVMVVMPANVEKARRVHLMVHGQKDVGQQR